MLLISLQQSGSYSSYYQDEVMWMVDKLICGGLAVCCAVERPVGGGFGYFFTAGLRSIGTEAVLWLVAAPWRHCAELKFNCQKISTGRNRSRNAATG